MILGMITLGSVQQHKTALGFTGAAKQKSVCTRISNFLKTFDFNFSEYAQAILEMAGLKGSLILALDRTNWKFGRIDINLLVNMTISYLYGTISGTVNKTFRALTSDFSDKKM